MKKLSMLAISLLIGLGIASLVVPTYAATSKESVCEGIGLTNAEGSCDSGTGTTSVDSVIKTVVGALTLIVGVAAVIMIIISGFKYITSSGDANSISSAKSTLTYAIVGLIIVALAQVIVRFVFTRATTAPASTNSVNSQPENCAPNIPC